MLEPQLEPEQSADSAFLSMRRTVADLRASGISVDVKHVCAEDLCTMTVPDVQALMRKTQADSVQEVSIRPAGIVMAWSRSALDARNNVQPEDDVVLKPLWTNEV